MPSPFRRLPPALHRPAIVVVLILGSASAGLALSTAKRQDSLLGLLAREPRGPVWWAIMAVAAVIVVRLTRARAVRWLVPIACGAAFLTVAELANERSGMSAVSRLPQVSPHQPLTLVATGTRETMTIRGLTRLAKESEAMKWQQTASRALTCDPPEDVTCQAVIRRLGDPRLGALPLPAADGRGAARCDIEVPARRRCARRRDRPPRAEHSGDLPRAARGRVRAGR